MPDGCRHAFHNGYEAVCSDEATTGYAQPPSDKSQARCHFRFDVEQENEGFPCVGVVFGVADYHKPCLQEDN